ncbi:hypothetical protein [Nocardia abscessus]|uniref:hypothetical protein n=1 Tax=Nocardia abscessus TaxID=120957 RepID=UPI002455AD26|nr:hypothetical protein [Nocardia abscessus]
MFPNWTGRDMHARSGDSIGTGVAVVTIDTIAVQGTATDLVVSTQTVLDLASATRFAAAQVTPAQVGQTYRPFGDRLSPACSDAARILARWGASIGDCTTALNRCATAYQAQKQDNRTSIVTCRLNMAA